MGRRYFWVAFMVSAAVLWYCGPVRAQSPGRRDSAGVTIVSNASRASARPAFLLGSVIATLGGLSVDPAREFNRRHGYLRAVRLSSGKFMVLDSDRMHLFGADLREHRVIGRKGSGPGEFRYLTIMCRTDGDTVIVWDDANRRLGVLTADGRLVRHLSLDGGAIPFQACGRGGKLLVVEPVFRAAEERSFDFAGKVIDLRGELRSGSLRLGPGSTDIVGRVTTQAMAGADVIAGDGLASEYRRISAAGKLLQIVRTLDAPVPLTGREYDKLLERMIPPQRDAKALRDRMKKDRTATHWPAYGQLLVDPAGCVWMQSFFAPTRSRGGADVWVAFDVAGRMLGRLDIPPPAPGGHREVLAIEKGEIQIRERTPDGEVYLRFQKVIPVNSGITCGPAS
ncbi:MAG: hypothetical protein SFU57_11110 [Gemmatimonadales bacterium]|nr:hypothetical protein [Gemmatimonadales bacterium]